MKEHIDTQEVAQQQREWHKKHRDNTHSSERLRAVANCLEKPTKDSNEPI